MRNFNKILLLIGLTIIAFVGFFAFKSNAQAVANQYCHFDDGKWSVNNNSSGSFLCTAKNCNSEWCKDNHPAIDCDGDYDNAYPNGDDECVTPTPTPKVCPTNEHANSDKVCVCNDGFTQVNKEEGFTCQPIVTPTATPSAQPSCTGQCGGPGDNGQSPSSTLPPVCTSGETIQLPANPFVIRNGNHATVNFFITQGDSANIFVRVSGTGWDKAVTSAPDVKPNGDNFVSYTFNDLNPNTDYDFGIVQKFSCGSGQMVIANIHDGANQEQIFRLTNWSWAN